MLIECWSTLDFPLAVDWRVVSLISHLQKTESLISLIDLHSLSARLFKKYNPEKSDSDVDDFELCM